MIKQVNTKRLRLTQPGHPAVDRYSAYWQLLLAMVTAISREETASMLALLGLTLAGLKCQKLPCNGPLSMFLLLALTY